MIQRYSWKSVTMLRVQNKLLINSPQVYLPAIEGHVPNLMVCMTQTFLNFCYIAWPPWHQHSCSIRWCSIQISTFQDNIFLCIMLNLFEPLELQMVFVPWQQSPSTSRQWRNLGNIQVILAHSSRCCSPISILTILWLHMSITLHAICSMEYVYHLFSIKFIVCTSIIDLLFKLTIFLIRDKWNQWTQWRLRSNGQYIRLYPFAIVKWPRQHWWRWGWWIWWGPCWA